MRKRTIVIVVSAAALAAGAGVGGAALAGVLPGTADDEEHQTLTGPDAERAKAAALAATGGGSAGTVERDGEGGAVYEVEVTKTDGTTVDVRLDGTFQVVTAGQDGEKSGEHGDDGRG